MSTAMAPVTGARIIGERSAGAPPAPRAIRDGLAVYALGEGTPLLCMPYPHAASVIGDLVPAALVAGLVRLGRRVVSFDPPGAGRSSRPLHLDLPELLGCAGEALEVAGLACPVDLLGHSQGALAALAFALEFPERVRRLVLACTAAAGPAYLRAGAIWRRGHPDYWRMGRWGLLYRLSRRRAPETLMLNAIFRASYVDRARFAPAPVAWRDWLRPARPRLWWNQRVARHLDCRGRLGEVRAPTPVLAGRHDPQMPPACGEELACGIPGARLVIFGRSGHYPFLEERDAFWRAVGGFLVDGRADEPDRPPPVAGAAGGGR